MNSLHVNKFIRYVLFMSSSILFANASQLILFASHITVVSSITYVNVKKSLQQNYSLFLSPVMFFCCVTYQFFHVVTTDINKNTQPSQKFSTATSLKQYQYHLTLLIMQH